MLTPTALLATMDGVVFLKDLVARIMTAGNFSITQEGVRLTIHGHVDSNNAVALGCALDKALKEGQSTIILNMLQVDFLCSTGIRVILKAYKEAQTAGGRLSIEEPSECVRNVLGVVALNEMLVQ
jgi:anti-anti-sigma factor